MRAPGIHRSLPVVGNPQPPAGDASWLALHLPLLPLASLSTHRAFRERFWQSGPGCSLAFMDSKAFVWGRGNVERIWNQKACFQSHSRGWGPGGELGSLAREG